MSEPLGLGMDEQVDRYGAFPRLGDEQRARLRAAGEVRTVSPGDVLFGDGDADYPFFVIESGAVAIVQGYGRENRVVAVHGAHRFLGELNLLTGAPAYLSGVVRDAGEVIEVPAARLRKLVSEDEDLSNLILRAYLARRSILIDLGAGVRLVGSRYSSDSRRLREFLTRNRVPYQWMDLDGDEEAEKLLRALGVKPDETPVVVGGRDVLRNPTNARVAEMLGLGSRGTPPAMCDLVIVGGGPGGLAAALYGASEGLDTQAIDAVVRRAGQYVGSDRELPRLPHGHLRERARRARGAAGQKAGRAAGRPGAGGWARAERRPFRDRARRRIGRQRSHGDRGDRGPVPQARPA